MGDQVKRSRTVHGRFGFPICLIHRSPLPAATHHGLYQMVQGRTNLPALPTSNSVCGARSQWRRAKRRRASAVTTGGPSARGRLLAPGRRFLIAAYISDPSMKALATLLAIVLLFGGSL